MELVQVEFDHVALKSDGVIILHFRAQVEKFVESTRHDAWLFPCALDRERFTATSLTVSKDSCSVPIQSRIQQAFDTTIVKKLLLSRFGKKAHIETIIFHHLPSTCLKRVLVSKSDGKTSRKM